MTVAPLLAAALVFGAPEERSRPSSDEVASAFRSLCHDGAPPLDALPARAAAAGYRSVPPDASPMTEVAAAWQRGGIVLFARRATAHPLLPTPPMCGVSADVGPVRSARRLGDRLARQFDDAFMFYGRITPRGGRLRLVGTDPDVVIHLVPSSGRNRYLVFVSERSE